MIQQCASFQFPVDGMCQCSWDAVSIVGQASSSLPINGGGGGSGTITRSTLMHLVGIGRVKLVNYSICLHRYARVVALPAHCPHLYSAQMSPPQSPSLLLLACHPCCCYHCLFCCLPPLLTLPSPSLLPWPSLAHHPCCHCVAFRGEEGRIIQNQCAIYSQPPPPALPLSLPPLSLLSFLPVGPGGRGWSNNAWILNAQLWECLTAACKAFSIANAKQRGTNGLVIRSLDD